MRREWLPVLARVYHIPPRDQGRLTLDEFRQIRDDYERVMNEEG